ncbi:hypothetical protein [Bombilactobacillus bombi]
MVIRLMMVMWWHQINKPIAAFTLIEAVITLGIVCALLLLPTINYHEQLELQQEKIAVIAFQSNWHNLVNDSFLYNEVRDLSFNSQKHQLQFIDPVHPERSYTQKLPAELECRLQKPFIRITCGEVTPQKIIFTSRTTKQQFKLTVQMHWGEIVEDKT